MALQRRAGGQQHARVRMLAAHVVDGLLAGQHDVLGLDLQPHAAEPPGHAARGVRGVVRDDDVAVAKPRQQVGGAFERLVFADQRAVEIDDEVAGQAEAAGCGLDRWMAGACIDILVQYMSKNNLSKFIFLSRRLPKLIEVKPPPRTARNPAMKPVFFIRGLCAAALVLSLAACGGGDSGSDAGAGVGAQRDQRPGIGRAASSDSSTADASTADERLLGLIPELGALTHPLLVLHIFELQP